MSFQKRNGSGRNLLSRKKWRCIGKAPLSFEMASFVLQRAGIEPESLPAGEQVVDDSHLGRLRLDHRPGGRSEFEFLDWETKVVPELRIMNTVNAALDSVEFYTPEEVITKSNLTLYDYTGEPWIEFDIDWEEFSGKKEADLSYEEIMAIKRRVSHLVFFEMAESFFELTPSGLVKVTAEGAGQAKYLGLAKTEFIEWFVRQQIDAENNLYDSDYPSCSESSIQVPS